MKKNNSNKQWPMVLAVVWLVSAVVLFFADIKIGTVASVLFVVYLIVLGTISLRMNPQMSKKLGNRAEQYGFLHNALLTQHPLPYAVLAEDGKILWANEQFATIFEKEQTKEHYLSSYIHELNRSVFPKEEENVIHLEVSYENRDYKATLTYISVKNLQALEGSFGFVKERESLVTVTLEDITELHWYIRENEGQKLVSGLIYFDNYEEVMESVEEVRQSLLIALIDRKVNQYMANFDGLVKKMEKDKYFFVVKKHFYKEMVKGKFAILEDAKSVNIGNTMPVTLSIGMGLSTETYAQSYNNARVAIDLALARGGDQAVVKDGKNIKYFGGKREQTSKNTRVKARVKAEALREFIMSKDQIVVMGHRMADVDSFGAAVGIYRAARTMQKKAHIVIDEITTSVRPFYNDFCGNQNYPDDMFVKPSEIHEYINDNTMLVVVDTNRPELTECPELLKKSKMTVVFDHHRQSDDVIENTVLSYIEPYASSACEMVAEMLQYIADDIKITAIEANSMYAGIMIDTNNFMNRTGVRTFEAAAFLKRCGADIVHVRKVFRDDLDWYRERSKVVSSAEIFREEYAIARLENEEIDSPTIIGAQAANELLNINGIKASFVLTEYFGKIYVSARAIDEVNVQIIMERLGGGGHINTAGTQFQHTDMDEAIQALKETIDTMIAEGDI